MATARLLFLPWLRQGFAARLTRPDTGAAGLPASVDLKVSLAVTGNAATDPGASVRVRGPADVIGIDPRQVVRTEPPDGSTDFEALDLAAIEFDNPDLPWMFTPAAADAQGRLRPWIVLVVLRVQDGVRLRPAGSEPLPVLEIAAPARVAEELPDLAESWAWAHAQLSWTRDEAPSAALVEQLIATRPELSVARLLSPRRLEAHTEYLACVVPAFEVGRCAGLGLPLPGPATLAPAWPNAQDPSRIALPVYYHWGFRTGAREDFETIVDRLVPRDLSEAVGRRPLDLGRPGFAFPAAPATPGRDGLIALEGALQPVGMPRMALADAAGPGWQAALQALLNANVGTDDDPVVGPPVYGRWLAGRGQVGTTSPPTWLDEINLDPRERIAAGLGTRVVQAQQDELVAQAWAQAGEIAAANQRLRQLQLAGAIGARLLQRHVEPFTRGQAGQDDALWRLAAPARARLLLPDPQAPQASASMRTLIARTNAADATLSAPLRRLTRPRGALARRAALLARKLDTAAPAAAPTGQLFKVFVAPQIIFRLEPPARGCVTIDDASRRAPPPNPSLLYAGMTDAAVAAAPKRPGFVVAAEPAPAIVAPPGGVLTRAAPRAAPITRIRLPGDELPNLPVEPPEPPEPPDPPAPPPPRPPPPPPPVDSADAAAFRAAARRHLALVNPAPAPVVGLNLLALGTVLAVGRPAVRAQLDPGTALAQRWRSAVQLSGAAPAPSAPATPDGTLGVIPRYRLPASEALARLSQDWLLPGLQQVPADTVALLEPNRRFIEAFMLGLNVEMTRELTWRDFPLAHELGTYFERFWRSARAEAPGDIVPLASWGNARLGQQGPREVTGAPQPLPLVLLLRSALLRRYPGTAVYAVRGVAQGTQRRPPEGAGEERAPLFRGALEPDLAFFGFDIPVAEAVGHPGWYFVLQQQPTEPRFGFDAQVSFGAGSHVSVLQRPGGMALPATTPWAAHAGQLAQLLRQLPVRVLIHASELLPS